MNVIGAQLYTLREHCQNIRDLAATLEKVRRIGYTAVQVSGIGPMEPADVARAASDAGVSIVATHMGWWNFIHETGKVIDTHHQWKCTHSAIGSLPKEYYSAEGLRQFLSELAAVAPKLLAEGIDFSFHNHSIEFIRLDWPETATEGETPSTRAGKMPATRSEGETRTGGLPSTRASVRTRHGAQPRLMLELLYELADPRLLKAEIDTYWIQAGGGNPAAWIRKLGPRQPLLHLKDYGMAAGEWQPRTLEVGQGNLDWPDILAAAREVGVQWYLIEQDNTYGRDPFESLKMSYEYLASLGLE